MHEAHGRFPGRRYARDGDDACSQADGSDETAPAARPPGERASAGSKISDLPLPLATEEPIEGIGPRVP